MIPIARGLLSARGVQARCDVVEGDFFQAVPAADVYLLKLITHDWDDDQSRASADWFVATTRWLSWSPA